MPPDARLIDVDPEAWAIVTPSERLALFGVKSHCRAQRNSMRRQATPSRRIPRIGSHLFHPPIAVADLPADAGGPSALHLRIVDVQTALCAEIAEAKARDRRNLRRSAQVQGTTDISRGNLLLDVLVGLQRIDVADLHARGLATERPHGSKHLTVPRNKCLQDTARHSPDGNTADDQCNETHDQAPDLRRT